MKKSLINIIAAGLILAFAGCTKSVDYRAERTYPTPATTFLKTNYLSAYLANPSVQLSINGNRVSGLITGRTPFPGGGFNTSGSNFPDYLALTPGSNTLTVAIPKKNSNTDSVALYSAPLNLESGVYYTLHVTDTAVKTKSFLQTDLLLSPATGSRYKFVNMMPNVPLMDLYYGTTVMATGIPYLTGSAIFELPVQATSLIWAIRETGTSPASTALATYTSTNTTIDQRIYTAFASGYKGQTATTTRPYISFLLNK